MQPDPAVKEQPGPDGPTAAAAPTAVPAEATPAPAGTDPAGTKSARPRRLVVWFAAAVVLILVAGGGAYFLLRPAAPPASIEALRDLLVNPTDRDSAVTMFPHDTIDGDTDSSPVNSGRWAVQREWSESPERTGYVLLMQFDTTDQARSSLDYYRQGASQDGAREQAVPGRANAYLYTLPASGDAKTSSTGLGQRGTIVVILGSGTESPDYVQSLLLKQLDLLP